MLDPARRPPVGGLRQGRPCDRATERQPAHGDDDGRGRCSPILAGRDRISGAILAWRGRPPRAGIGALTLRGLTAAVFAVGLLGTLGVGPAAADLGITFDAHVWIAGVSTGGGPFATDSDCESGVQGTETFRCAFEFDLSTIPAGSTFHDATLTYSSEAGCPGGSCSVSLGGYAGDGAATFADLTAGSALVTFPNGSGPSDAMNDVSTFVGGLYAAHERWAGFNLAGTGGPIVWGTPASDVQPVLTVAYGLPAASATATQPATDTAPGPTAPATLPLLELLFLGTVAVVVAALPARSHHH
jgi:hypothetical protein